MLEKYGLITSVSPVGGWVFPQPYEGGVHEVRGSDGPDLVKRLLDFRLKAKLPIGDPEREVALYIKEKSPINARFHGYTHKTRAERKPVPKFVPLIERIRASMAELIELKPRFVSEDEAAERTDCCKNCPHNVEWRIKTCAPCNEEADYLSLVLRQRTAFEFDSYLHACRLHNLHLPSAVFLDREVIPERSAEAPDLCWIGRPPLT